MSVALEMLPEAEFSTPLARPWEVPHERSAPGRLATVTVLRPPRAADAVAPVRLTRRGVVVLSLAVLAVCGALVWLAALSAPTSAGSARPGPARVTVRPGDTLWGIASRVAPQRDPRAEIALLQRLNGLHDVALVPGQVLRLR